MSFKNTTFIIELNLGKNLLTDLAECYFSRINSKLELPALEVVHEYLYISLFMIFDLNKNSPSTQELLKPTLHVADNDSLEFIV